MPGETRISQTVRGWIDLDNPTIGHRTRQDARDARRVKSTDAPSQRPTFPLPSPDATLSQALTSLQSRLLDRLVVRQGISVDDAYDVIKANGYNAAASYGHMREAGATHHEALLVIGLDSPSISLDYGRNRQNGWGHTDALMAALRDNTN